jgi:hypothetical protein
VEDMVQMMKKCPPHENPIIYCSSPKEKKLQLHNKFGFGDLKLQFALFLITS